MPEVSPPAVAMWPLSTKRKPRRNSMSGNSFAKLSKNS
jgi:hypothetical protein